MMTSFIPGGLSQAETLVYQKLIRVAKQREARGQAPRPIVVITDVGKDYDDLAALTVLKELHRLRLVELRAVIANLMPADKRARFARVALDSLGLPDVPVARGTRGSPGDHEELAHEFSWGDVVVPADVPLQDGQDLLREVYQKAKEKGEKLHLLCLSSLQDIHEFASTHPHLVAECTADVHMQGGNYVSNEGKLEPDSKACNNRFNLDAAAAWHSFIQTNGLPSYTYTKIAAFAAPLTSDVFVELEATGHPVGAYLRRVKVEQDLAFYKRACESDPKKRFAPFMDQSWFLAKKTNWHQQEHAEGDALPTGKEVIPYLTKIVLYDVFAALGVAGEDVVSKLKVFQSTLRTLKSKSQGEGVAVHHWITGDELNSAASPREISLALPALMKGSLLVILQEDRASLHTKQQQRTKCTPMGSSFMIILHHGKESDNSISAVFRCQPRLTAGQIRLLHLLPGKGSDDICCTIHFSNLDSSPQYEAVSYAWGKDTLETNCQYDCRRLIMTIRNNLDSVLRALRYVDRTRVLWVDAVCINQDDGDEQSKQVGIMCNIYRQAGRGVAWVGEEDRMDQAALDVGKYLQLTSRDPFTLEELETWLSLLTFIRRPLFSRVWIVQELAVAKRLTIYCGQRQMEWDTLRSGLIMFLDRMGLYLNTSKADMSLERVFTLVSVGNLVTERFREDAQEPVGQFYQFQLSQIDEDGYSKEVKAGDLLHFVKGTRLFGSTNPSDYIFALLREDSKRIERIVLREDSERLEINYFRPYTYVYREFCEP